MDQVPDGPKGPQDASHGLPVCYRHPDRETGIRCTRCERPVCPECMVSASVGFQCPECVRGGSGSGRAPSASRPRTLAGGAITADPRLVTKILIGINAAVFLATLAAGNVFTHTLWLIGLAYDQVEHGVVGVGDGQWYRLFTAMFLHQQFLHIGMNMLGLWWLGGPLEAALGRVRYLALYLISGLAGSALTYLVASPATPSLGASGAIFGVFGATAVLMRRMRYDMRPVVALLAINLVFTFTVPGIAWEAHVGGLVAGVIIAYALVHAPRERRALVQWGACAAVLLITMALVLVRTAQLT
ncbi:rhomboid family intramembrane serine protease [Streptomyces sp. NPDC058045]|uniref:rhomboid family intramembrane serine protease n=1 Tax=Streptomyces sp. NPDC058045 TaxID=3346311 RepID=UPI0036E5CDCE